MAASEAERQEFVALSAKVAGKSATEEERARWRELRARLTAARPATPPPGASRRQHARVPKKLRVAYAAATELTVTFSDEVGGGGVRLRAPRHFEPGTELVLRLEPGGAGDEHPIVTVGRVAWSRREGGHFTIGVELPSLRADERDRVEAFAHAPAAPPEE